MNEEKIKEAFTKAKQDMFNLHRELSSLKEEIASLKSLFIQQAIQQTNKPTGSPTDNSTENAQNPAFQHINPAPNTSPAHLPADNFPLKAVKTPNFDISTGNEGVPADRQTDQQTDNSTGNEGVKVRLIQEDPSNNSSKTLPKVAEVLNSIDIIKKELKRKFKRLTAQELVVFSTIYQLEEEGQAIDYPLISQKLSLTESSIRDYVQRLIKKEIPIIKSKENNKKIILAISPDLKKIATLSTILSFKENK